MSSSVLNEFIRMNGTLTLYSELRCYPANVCKVSICAQEERKGVAHLNLPDRKIKESHSIPNLNDRLGAYTTHRSSQSTIQLQHGQLIQCILRARRLRQLLIRNNLIRRRRLDLVPYQFLPLCAIREEAVEERKEAGHFCVKGFALDRVLDARDEVVELVAHRLGGYAGCGGFEVLKAKEMGSRESASWVSLGFHAILCALAGTRPCA